MDYRVLKLFVHVEHMSKARLNKRVKEIGVEGKRETSKPYSRWLD